eukprot:Rmarinus@m.26842
MAPGRDRRMTHLPSQERVRHVTMTFDPLLPFVAATTVMVLGVVVMMMVMMTTTVAVVAGWVRRALRYTHLSRLLAAAESAARRRHNPHLAPLEQYQTRRALRLVESLKLLQKSLDFLSRRVASLSVQRVRLRVEHRCHFSVLSPTSGPLCVRRLRCGGAVR